MSRGAAIESDPIYISSAKEIISALNRIGFKVTQSEAIPPPIYAKKEKTGFQRLAAGLSAQKH